MIVESLLIQRLELLPSTWRSSLPSGVIGTREVEDLPLNGHAYADLAALVPGVCRNTLENQLNGSLQYFIQRLYADGD